MLERDPAHVADGRRAPGRDDIVVGLLLLQHQPHRANIVARMAPVALGVDVAEPQFLSQPKFDARDAVRHLSGDEFDAAQGALMIEQDAGRCVQAEALAIIDRDPVAIEFSDGIGRTRMKRRQLALHRLADLAVHLRGRCLVEARLRRADAHRLQHVDDADPGNLRRQNRLVPGRGDEALRREIVDLIGLYLLDDAQKARYVGKIAIDELYLLIDLQPL